MIRSVIASLLLGCISLVAAAVETSTTNRNNSDLPASYSPQVCQFSLSKYTGTVSSGSTGTFTVGLSCPQPNDTYATVIVFIDDAHVASKVIKVPAGKTQSQSESIHVGTSYNGKSYQLIVQ